jgi:murein hydrolase activator
VPNSLFELSVRIRMPSQYLSLNIVLSLFFILVGNISLAAEQSGTSQQQEAQQNLQAVSSAIDEIQSWLENANRRQSEEEQNLREAELEFSSLNQSLTATENSITESESEIATLNAEQMRFESEKSEQEENLRSLIRRAYLSGEQGFLKLLLNQEDLSKSARMLHYYRVFSESQVKQIEEFERLIEELADTNRQLEIEVASLSDQKIELDRQSVALTEANTLKQIALTDLTNSITSQRAELEQLEINQAEIQQLIEEINRAVEQLATATNFNEQKGKLSLPLDGPVIERFGERVGSSDLRRQGIVLRAEEGTPVQAIHGGRVVFANWLRGSGLLIIVDHGEGFMSLYGANQALSRSAGDVVSAGDILATSGHTSTGSEGSRAGIYFEIRVHGQAENPADWIEGI